VLFVDDAQLLDETSRAYSSADRHDAVLVVLTVRSGEPVPAELTELWKDDLAVRLNWPGSTPIGSLLC